MAGSCKSSSEDRHVFLFSDLLLLATIVTPNILNRNQRIHLLRDVLLAEDIQDTNSWKIVLPGKTRAVPSTLSYHPVFPDCQQLELEAGSREEKRQWLEVLQLQLVRNQQTSLPLTLPHKPESPWEGGRRSWMEGGRGSDSGHSSPETD